MILSPFHIKKAGLNGFYGRGRFHQLIWCWWRVLRFMLPDSLARCVEPSTQSLVLLRLVDGDLVSVLYDGSESIEKVPFTQAALSTHDWSDTLARIKHSSCPVLFLLEPHQIFSKQLTLPMDSEKNLDQLLAYDMDRLTPMDVSQVYYDFRITHRDKSSKTITVSIYIVQRHTVDELIHLLGLTPLPVHGIDVARDIPSGFSIQAINVLPKKHRATVAWQGLSASVSLTLIVVFIIGMGQFYSVSYKNEQIAHWSQKVSTSLPSTTAMVDLKKQVDEAEDAAQFILTQRNGAQAISGVLHRLTQVLPDTTYIEQLYIKNNEVELHGLSTAAASLIPLLEKSPWFSEATLRAAIVQDKATQKERYKIRVISNVDIINDYEHALTIEKPLDSEKEVEVPVDVLSSR